MTNVFTLLIVYQIKHFICDYPLQGRYMLGKFKTYPAYIVPLLAHVLVHGVFTFVIVSLVNPSLAAPLALFDMVVHFIMDRIKASPNMLGRFESLSKTEYEGLLSNISYNKKSGVTCVHFYKELKSNTYFWYSLGLDQMVHHLTHYVIIYWLVT